MLVKKKLRAAADCYFFKTRGNSADDEAIADLKNISAELELSYLPH